MREAVDFTAGEYEPVEQQLLVADDDVGLTRIVALTASTLGIVTTEVNDPMCALDVFIAARPHVVMLDICMPEKDGIDLLNEILLTGIPTRVLLTSGNGDGLLEIAQDTMRLHGLKAAPVLAKPFRRAELVDALTRLAT